MACDLETAVRVLQRGHVRWQRLHPSVRARLARAGWDARLIEDTEQREDHQRAHQHGERARSGNWGPRR